MKIKVGDTPGWAKGGNHQPRGNGGSVQTDLSYADTLWKAATLRYHLAEPGDVSLAVYDLLGREVARLVDASRRAGRHRAELPESATAGTDFVQPTVAGEQVNQRFTRVR